jgi:hypothetical protein
MKTIGAAIAALALVAAACSGDDGGDVEATVEADQADDEASFDALAYQVSYDVCRLIVDPDAPEGFDDTGITVDPNTDPVGYAREYGRTQYPGRDQIASDGCIDGLEGNPPDRTKAPCELLAERVCE